MVEWITSKKSNVKLTGSPWAPPSDWSSMAKTNSSPLKSYLRNRKVVFQAPFFRCFVKLLKRKHLIKETQWIWRPNYIQVTVFKGVIYVYSDDSASIKPQTLFLVATYLQTTGCKWDSICVCPVEMKTISQETLQNSSLSWFGLPSPRFGCPAYTL